MKGQLVSVCCPVFFVTAHVPNSPVRQVRVRIHFLFLPQHEPRDRNTAPAAVVTVTEKTDLPRRDRKGKRERGRKQKGRRERRSER